MAIVSSSTEPKTPPKYVQSSRSRLLQFSARMCALCNGSRTQPADKEFDRLHSLTLQLVKEGNEPEFAFADKRYIEGSACYLNIFRYFAKLLCCHLAEVNAPRPVHMSQFAIGNNDRNCIWLRIRHDWTYQQYVLHVGRHPYAAHGGLVVYVNNWDKGPNAFHSTLTIGAVQYVFFSRLTWFERIALRVNHRKFYTWCRERGVEFAANPMSDIVKRRLGVIGDE